MEEIDLFLASNDLMPPGIEDFDYDSEGDIRFLKELLSNDSPPFPENESPNLDHFSSPRPPPEPPDVKICFDFEPDTAVKNDFDELNDDDYFDPGEVRIMWKMTIPSHLSFGLLSCFSPTLRFLPYFASPEMRTPFFTPASPLRVGGLSSGWNF
ncbi:hypothetical protein Tco_0207885, partial [Tanacetum coccineum]